MARVSIIGTGNMGQAIAAIATKGGHTIELLDTSDAGKPVTGDLVVLAVPYPAISGVIAVPTARKSATRRRVPERVAEAIASSVYERRALAQAEAD